MATLILRSTDVGAPTLSGTNGALCSVLDWALVQNGWAIEYTASNNRIYRAGVGNRFRLFVSHDSTVSSDARLATIRGCENAAAASSASLTDPFPTVAQVANSSSTVLCSITAAATARAYIIIVTPTAFVMAINCASSNTTNWDMFGFGDASGVDSTDSYGAFVWIGASATVASAGGRGLSNILATHAVSSGRIFWCRSIDGAVKSTHGCMYGSTNSASPVALGAIGTLPVLRGGYGNRIVREKVGLTCLGSSTTTAGVLAQLKRGWIPSLYAPLHNGIGAVTSDDTFEDLTSGADFQIIPGSSAAAILETSDTWSVPSG